MPYITFAVTCYNFAPFIVECLESILTQESATDSEIIVIDDASSDESDNIIRTFSDPRIRYIRHATNQGASATILEGLNQARGTYVARIDGDDRYRADFLEQTLPILEQHPEVSLAYGDVARMDAQGEIEQDPWTGIRSHIVHHGHDFKGDEFLMLVAENVVPVPTMLMRRATLLPDLAQAAGLLFVDWYLTLRIARAHQTYYLARTLADYRIHPQNRHRQLGVNSAYAPTVLRILDQIFDEPDRQAAKQKIKRRVYGRAFLRFGDNAFGTGQMMAARRNYSRALMYTPALLLNPKFVRHYLGTWLGGEQYGALKAQWNGVCPARRGKSASLSR
jgi:glycosyltransferase involved in cell wall biosynthesis